MFMKNYIISGEIVCKTGLHIGGSNDAIDIGGSDNPIIRDSTDELPFIPGSSLKGKLRSLLELSDEESIDDIIKNEGEPSKIGEAAEYFGTADDEKAKNFNKKVIVRDAYPTDETIELWRKNPDIIDGAEIKYENNLNRITSAAGPRNIERVPKDSKFNFEIILTLSKKLENDKEKKACAEDNFEEEAWNVLKPLFISMKLLEDDYLGGSGTRGFGKIKFCNIKVKERNLEYYTKNEKEESIGEGKTLKECEEDVKDKE